MVCHTQSFRALCLYLTVVSVLCTVSNLSVSINGDGSYSITLDGIAWFVSDAIAEVSASVPMDLFTRVSPAVASLSTL